MLRHFFIPVLLVLVTIAAALYWLFHNGNAPRDVRDAVPVERFTLRNGLQVVVMPSDRLPAVTHILFVRAGGGDDPYGKTGLAHYLEHLMFSGTKEYPEGVYDRAINKVGGEQNAYTQRDFTAYYATVPKDFLKQVMAMEADRLAHIEINDFHAARELKVITEERNMRVENKAPDLLAEQIDAMTFLNHPYGHPLIGWAEDMKTFTAADARSFFKKYYRASNMVLVIAGDVQLGEVKRMVQHYYGNLPAGGAPVRAWPAEPPMRMSRRGEMHDAKARQPRLLRQYVAPSVNVGDAAQAMPLSLFTQYLGGGTTSRLYQTLVVEQKLASNVVIYYDPLDVGPSMVRLWVVPAPGVALPQLEAALDAAIEASLGELPAEEEVARAKTQLKAEVIYAQDGLGQLAHLMGQLVMIGKDENYFYNWTGEVDGVTATAMLEAAQKTFDPARKVTGYLLPEQDPAPAVEETVEETAEPEAAAPEPLAAEEATR